MGLQKHYLRYGRSARDRLLMLAGGNVRIYNSDGGGFSADGPTRIAQNSSRPTPLSMLISRQGKINNNRLAVVIIGLVTLSIGVILSSIPWLDYFILKNLRLWNDTLSFHYWQRPGVSRFTRVYVYNVTNANGFLNGEKPKLQEVGPFVYREDMEKVNIHFYDNLTVSYQHKKILRFIPELSIDRDTRIITPNIPLLTLTSLSPKLGYFISKTLSMILTAAKYEPFVSLTAEQLVFGYDDTLVSLAHRFYPRNMRPMSQMGLLLARNGTLTEVSNIKTGYAGMDEFGYIDKLNGLDHLPTWKEKPCTRIAGSEGSFFPPRDITKANTVYLYDKDLCRVIPLNYVEGLQKEGIDVDLYRLPENAYGDASNNSDNTCFDIDNYESEKGIQNISPCHYGAPVFISQPHFYQADPYFLNTIEGLKPNQSKHETFFKIQPRLGVPLEGYVRIQLNLKVTHAKNIFPVRNFRNFMFPIMWLEEGISEVTPAIYRWIYLSTVLVPYIIPILSYFLIISGSFALMFTFVRTYQSLFPHSPTLEIPEMGRRTIRHGSTFIAHQQIRLQQRTEQRDSCALLPESSSQSSESRYV